MSPERERHIWERPYNGTVTIGVTGEIWGSKQRRWVPLKVRDGPKREIRGVGRLQEVSHSIPLVLLVEETKSRESLVTGSGRLPVKEVTTTKYLKKTKNQQSPCPFRPRTMRFTWLLPSGSRKEKSGDFIWGQSTSFNLLKSHGWKWNTLWK